MEVKKASIGKWSQSSLSEVQGFSNAPCCHWMTRPITRTLFGKMAEMKMLQLNKNTYFFFLKDNVEWRLEEIMQWMICGKANLNSKIDSHEMNFICILCNANVVDVQVRQVKSLSLPNLFLFSRKTTQVPTILSLSLPIFVKFHSLPRTAAEVSRSKPVTLLKDIHNRKKLWKIAVKIKDKWNVFKDGKQSFEILVVDAKV
ncbi:hypothetical protein P8452_37413 [Trifolium repens]|nr:hypothetical protein P8452_37413 [Trifolium repens]